MLSKDTTVVESGEPGLGNGYSEYKTGEGTT